MTTAHLQHRTRPLPTVPGYPSPTASRPEAAPPAASVGAAIYSRDRRCLGRVKEVGECCFLVDARFAFDYWLSTRAVVAVEEGRVLLGIDKRDVGDYLVDVDCLEDFEDLDPVTERGIALGFSHAAS